MNEPERAELKRLREQQARIEAELRALSQQLTTLEQRFAEAQPAAAPARHPTANTAAQAISAAPPITPAIIRALPTSPATPPPLISQVPIQSSSGSTPAAPVEQKLQPQPSPIPDPAAADRSATSPRLQPEVQRPPQPKSAPPPIPLPPLVRTQVPERSFEMRLGTFWLVRIGIVMVLTGLVFFGNLAYQNYISKLGAGGKVGLLYGASGAMLAAGWWLQRSSVKETLRNYAQVILAGGLAALYFTTYAAHHLERLRVIQSATLDGLLLLGCAASMIWAAERKKSEVLALFAVGLAYYTSIITRVGYFTLWSNCILSGAAVLFLVRNRWAALSFASLAATYAGYGFWRFFNGSEWHWAAPESGLWSGTWFLICYWLIFTVAVFLSRDTKLSGQNRAGFLTLNNGAFFTLFLLTMIQVQQGGFWKFALIYGGVLLALSVLASVLLADEPLASNTYLTQGLLLATVGFISKFAGLHLALILATESVVLLITGQQRKNLVLLTGAYIAAALSVGWGMDGLKPLDTREMWLAIGLGIMMTVNAYLTHRQLAAEAKPGTAENPQPLLRPQPSYFAVLALVIWGLATWHNTSRETFPLVLATEAVVLTGSIYFLRIREVSLLSQGLMLLALGAWFINWNEPSTALPWWNPAILIALNLALSHWWPRQKQIISKGQDQTLLLWPALYALGITAVLYLWLAPKESTPDWLLMTSLLAVGLTVYGVTTRAWFVAGFGQLFLLVSVAQFGWQLWQSNPPWHFPLAPIIALGALSIGTVQWFRLKPGMSARVREPLLEAALIYRWVALAMSITWICEYVPARERIWVLSVLGLSVFLWSGRRKSQEGLMFSAVFTATALALFWLPLIETSTVYWPNLIAILVLLTQRQIARRFPNRYPQDAGIHNAVITTGGLSLWLFVSRWVLEMASGFYLTASWSLLALGLFTAGLVLRERMYRWLGLGVLACALARVVIFDVWKLETVYRILSFMALGIVLLVLGFIYSKYQEKIKEWL